VVCIEAGVRVGVGIGVDIGVPIPVGVTVSVAPSVTSSERFEAQGQSEYSQQHSFHSGLQRVFLMFDDRARFMATAEGRTPSRGLGQRP
jgi:hypothetical protein